MAKITAEVGKVSPFTLWAAGGTGYSWMLTSMPDGLLALQSITMHSTGIGAPEATNFVFVGLKAGTGKATFVLARPFALQENPKTISVDVSVTDGVANALKAEAGTETFAPLSYVECEGEHQGKTIVAAADDANCMVKYGGYPNCTLKYGIPVQPHPLFAVNPTLPYGVMLYMAQPSKPL